MSSTLEQPFFNRYPVVHPSGGRTELYLVRHSPRHRWAYFAEMDRHEALVFKTYDSQVNGVAPLAPQYNYAVTCP